MAARRGGGPHEDDDSLASAIGRETFDEWYRTREVAENVRRGTPFFNTPSPVPEPGRIPASRLLTCHRKLFYVQHNAPKETREPRGVFWAGSTLETEVIAPYLAWLADEHLFVQNSIRVETSVETDRGELTIAGETDPAVVRSDGTPVLVTEVKTTRDIDAVDGPRVHHRAQLHAYLRALSEEWSTSIDGVLVYLDRDSFEVKAYPVAFDGSFWDDVVAWAAAYLSFRRTEQLPPADPVYGWECDYCDYRHRCGRTELPFADEGPDGLLPRFDYPEEAVVEYLDARGGATAKATPTVARHHPTIAESFAVHDWACERCGERYQWDSVEWDGPDGDPPHCPPCSTELQIPIPLRPPSLSTG